MLRIPARHLARWAARFADDGGADEILARIRPRVLARGHLTRAEFLTICAWKSSRTSPRCRENSVHAIRTRTSAAFATCDEAQKIDFLRTLRGVEWSTASSILHFCDARPYPILDYRALWSLGFATPPAYTMAFWLDYLSFTRGLAARLEVPIRTLDKALWQYSKERQRRRPRSLGPP